MADYSIFSQAQGPTVDTDLYPRAMAQGVAMGNQQKTTTQAIIEGSLQGIQTGQQLYGNYQQEQIRQQQIDQAPLELEIKKQQLENQRMVTELNTMKLKIAAETQAEELRLAHAEAKSKLDIIDGTKAINDALTSDNPQSKRDIFNNPQANAAISADRKVAESALGMVMTATDGFGKPLFTPEEQAAAREKYDYKLEREATLKEKEAQNKLDAAGAKSFATLAQKHADGNTVYITESEQLTPSDWANPEKVKIVPTGVLNFKRDGQEEYWDESNTKAPAATMGDKGKFNVLIYDENKNAWKKARVNLSDVEQANESQYASAVRASPLYSPSKKKPKVETLPTNAASLASPNIIASAAQSAVSGFQQAATEAKAAAATRTYSTPQQARAAYAKEQELKQATSTVDTSTSPRTSAMIAAGQMASELMTGPEYTANMTPAMRAKAAEDFKNSAVGPANSSDPRYKSKFYDRLQKASRDAKLAQALVDEGVIPNLVGPAPEGTWNPSITLNEPKPSDYKPLPPSVAPNTSPSAVAPTIERARLMPSSFTKPINDAQIEEAVNALPVTIKKYVNSKVVSTVQNNPLVAGQEPIIRAIVSVESGGKENAKSDTGVKGLMQVTDAAAKDMGVDNTTPEGNVAGGVKYFKMLKKHYDDKYPGQDENNEMLALMAYNGGVGLVDKAIKKVIDYAIDVSGSTDAADVAQAIKQMQKQGLYPDILVKNKADEIISYPAKVLAYKEAYNNLLQRA